MVLDRIVAFVDAHDPCEFVALFTGKSMLLRLTVLPRDAKGFRQDLSH